MISLIAPRSAISEIAEEVAHLGDDQLLALLVQPRQRADALHRLREVLDQQDGLLGIAALPPAMLVQLGLPVATARIIAGTFELGRRVAAAKRRARPSCRTPEEVALLMAPQLIALPAEEMWVLPLDSKSRLIGEARMASRGCSDGTDACPRTIMHIAISSGASSVIIVHQHPSGEPDPSASDRAVTTRIAAAGRICYVLLQDHVIIGSGGRFASLRRSDPELFR
jgi:DNA repair protein RadC